MVVICDSSTLINLSLINQLRLLEEMFGGVLVPKGVHEEVVERGAGRVGVAAVRQASFIQVEEIKNPDDVEQYINPLSPEDAEILILAKEQKADLVLTNDRQLRRRARGEGFAVASTRDFLLSAKQQGFIQAIKPLLDELRRKGVLIREGIYQETLRQAGELPSK